jgi:hypothetical protein
MKMNKQILITNLIKSTPILHINNNINNNKLNDRNLLKIIH